MDENPRTINYYQQEFPELTIIKDSTADRVWEKHGATPHDHFIYDRYRLIFLSFAFSTKNTNPLSDFQII